MFLRQKIEADPHLALHQRHSGANGMSSLSSDFNDARGPASPFHWTGLPIESDMNFFPDFAGLNPCVEEVLGPVRQGNLAIVVRVPLFLFAIVPEQCAR